MNHSKKDVVSLGKLSFRGIIIPNPVVNLDRSSNSATSFKVGDKVQANYKMKGKWIPGILLIEYL